jgi:hypothetical protein
LIEPVGVAQRSPTAINLNPFRINAGNRQTDPLRGIKAASGTPLPGITFTRQFIRFTVKITGFAMSNTANNQEEKSLLSEAGPDLGLYTRIFRVMVGATGLAVFISVLFAPWRVTTGLLIGGLLSLINHHWLQTSVSAVLALAVGGEKPKLNLAKFILRYLVIGAVAFIAYKFGIASLPALLAGLCTFVLALFAEAVREIYLVIIHREEIT